MQSIISKTLGKYKPESVSEIERFEKVAKPLIDFLNENYHPHVTVIVTPCSAELMEGLIIHNSGHQSEK